MQNVFYNPIQQFNRDLSVLAIRAFGEDVCHRKTQRHKVQCEQRSRRKDNKRKRVELQEDRVEAEGDGLKMPKIEGDVPVPEENGNAAAARLVANGTLETDTTGEHDGGVSIIEHDQSAVDPPSAQTESTTASDSRVGHEEEPPKEWRPRFRILDALSATGLRALRYASEIPSATAIVANDRDGNAAKNIRLNVQHNDLSSLITTTTGDAQGHMYSAAFPAPHTHGPNHVTGRYDIIDLDPYGTAAPFIDASLQALEDGGMLCVTCTDSGVWASCGYSEKTFALYNGMPIKGSHSHEGGLRLILHSIATNAAKHGIAIEPLLSLSIDFYARIFIRVRKSARDVKFLAGKTMLVYGCDHGCGAWTTQSIGRHVKQPSKGKEVNWKYSIAQAPSADRLCDHCGSKTHVAGPMWGGPIHNPAFIERLLDDVEQVDPEVYETKPRLEGMLTTALDELSVNADAMDYRARFSENESGKSLDLVPQVPPEALDHHPFFFIPSALCKVLKATAPPEVLVKGALRHAGYRVTRSHCKPGSLKTDAPWSFVWEVMREWVRQRSPIKEGSLKEGSPGIKILDAMRQPNDPISQVSPANPVSGDTTDGEHASVNGVIAQAEVKRGTKVVFDEKLGKDKEGKRLVRYQQNPRENWGPMTKAKGHA